MNNIDKLQKVLNVKFKNPKLLVEALSYVSVFVSFILGFSVIYASRFLIKKRKKEFL